MVRLMLARVWKGSVRRKDVDEYTVYMRETGVVDYASTPGNRGVWMLRRDRDDDVTELVMLTLWESVDAVRAFAGEDYEQAVFYPRDDRFLVERDLHVTHYDVALAVGRERAAVTEFLSSYRAAFETFDADAIADLFAFPCHVTGGGAPVGVAIVPSRDAWRPQLERLLDAYRRLDVRTARVVAVETSELGPDLLQAVVRWELLDRKARRIYEFDASYTLADLGEGLRVTAIAHNESPRRGRA